MRRMWGALVFVVSTVMLLAACGGGGGESTPSDPDPNPTDPTTPVLPDPAFSGQALLGPLADATVKLYTLDNVTQALATAKTLNSTDLSVAGTFSLPKSAIASDQLYLITVSGGVDLDSNDDGVADPPVANNATLHALVPGSAMLSGTTFNVSLATEVLYQRLRLLLATGERSTATLLTEAAFRARQLLTQELTRDNTINLDDVLQWHPARHRSALRVSAEQQILVTDRLRDGNSVASFALEWMSSTVATSAESVASDIALAGTKLINADQQRGLVIYDIAQPDVFSELSVTLIPHNDTTGNLPYWTLGTLAVADNTLFATASYGTTTGAFKSALLAIDISNPAQPVVLGTLPFADGTWLSDLRATSTALYAIAGNVPGNIAVFDTRTPSAMTRAADITTGAAMLFDLILDNGTLYATTGEALLRYDTRTPLAPTLIDNVAGSFGTLAVRDDLMINVDPLNSIELYRLAGTAAPNRLSRIAAPAALTGLDYYSGRPVFADSTFFIGAAETNASVDGDIQRFDITDPANPRLVGTLATNTSPAESFYVNDRLYVMTSIGTLRILSTDLATGAQRLTTLNLGSTSEGLLADQQRLYQYDFAAIDTLSAVGIHQTAPTITRYDPVGTNDIRAIALRDNVAYIAGSRNLLDIVQFDSVSGNGTLVGTVTPPDTMNIAEVMVEGNSAWVIGSRRTDGIYKLFDIDISNRSSPIIRSEARLDDSTIDTRRVAYAARAGSALYVQRGGTIAIVDASNPSAPLTRSTVATAGFPIAFTVRGSLLVAITSTGDPDLHSDDVAVELYDTAANALIPPRLSRTVLANHGRFGQGIWKQGAAVNNNVLYIAMGAKGTYAIDITNPRAPALLGQLDSIGPANSVVVTPDNIVTVLDGTGQLNLFTGVGVAARP